MNYPDAVPQKILVRRLGVDTPAFKPPRSQQSPDFSILSVGRLHPVKDHAFLVQACWLLKCRGVRFVCRIAGDGPEHQALEGMIRDFGLQHEVSLLGQLCRGQLDQQYDQADLVVLTSRSEGIPLVLMEAMVRGKPVLGPAITGIPELVLHGTTGFLYQAGSLDDFMAQVTLIISTQSALGPMLQTAQEHVLKHFNREANLAAICDLFTPYLQVRPVHASSQETTSATYENPLLQ
jgi:glycosyltransferase involved in cell wall biosynthesis